jgi:iron(III) transport system permease protein
MLPGQRLIDKTRLALVAAAIVLAGITLLSPAPTRRVLLNSAWLAGGATAIALPLGTLLAVLLTRFALPGRGAAAACLGLLLFLPLYVQISGWDAAIGKLGWYTLAYGSGPRPWLAGLEAAIFLHGLAAAPWTALIVGLGLAKVDARQEEAALLETSPLGVLLGVTLPQCRPFLIAAGLWVAVSTANEMTVTNIYLVDPREMTYTEQFYMNYSLAADAQQAVLAALPGLAGLTVLILATLWVLALLTARGPIAGSVQRVVFPSGGATAGLTTLLWTLVLALLAVPLCSLIAKAGFVVERVGDGLSRSWSASKSLEVVAQAPWRFGEEFAWTAAVAIPAASVALLLAIALAWPARRGGGGSIPALLASVVCLATPGPIVGVAMIHLFNSRWSGPLAWAYHATLIPTILASMIHSLPLAILLAWHSLATLSDDELSAAALDGAGPVRRLWLIALPQRWLALAGVWLATFAIAAGDLAWSILVIPPGVDTVQRRVFDLIHFGAEEQVAGMCLVVVGAYTVLAAAVVWLLGKETRSTKHETIAN